MRGLVAKRLRKQVYGKEYSHRERKYKRSGGQFRGGSRVNVGRRAEYLKLKQSYIRGF